MDFRRPANTKCAQRVICLAFFFLRTFTALLNLDGSGGRVEDIVLCLDSVRVCIAIIMSGVLFNFQERIL